MPMVPGLEFWSVPKNYVSQPKENLCGAALMTQLAYEQKLHELGIDADKENQPVVRASSKKVMKKSTAKSQKTVQQPAVIKAALSVRDGNVVSRKQPTHVETENVRLSDSEHEFKTIGRPLWDLWREHPVGMFDDASDKEKAKLCKQFDAQQKKCNAKDPSKHPKWKWIMSRRSTEMLNSFDEEIAKRDPEEYGVYFGNDWMGYGVQEVIEGHMQSFFNEFRKGKCDAMKLWHHMEAIAYFFCDHNGPIHAWYSKSATQCGNLPSLFYRH